VEHHIAEAFDVVVASVEEAIGRPNMIEFIANMTAATS